MCPAYTRPVDPNALIALEFPAIAERIAGRTATEHGAELARSLVPSPDPEEVARRQALTAEAIGLLDTAEEPPLDGIRDVREPATLAARGGVLNAKALRDFADTISGALRVRAALDDHEEAPLLRELAAAIDPGLAPLAKAIDRAVEPDGSDLKDNASPRLRKLRVELRTGRQRVTEKLEQLVRKTGVREHLQEDFVTQRAGRPVLAVKASSRSSVPGIVHDSSDSGQTLFVEPFDVVELNNRQSEAAGAEREEAERILRELSSVVGERADALELLVAATARIDLAVALGSVSRGWRGARVEVSDEVRLVGARHPLLDPTNAVPIDLELGDLRALVISGPNTGGKTVALKTLGLAALLHQSGLRPPAATASLPIFDEVLADIGDPQSIEMSLSTFSGHVANLVSILDAARERSLVLVDELASGTDPVEGSALAQALLARLARQARLTVVTTHYPELKEWASATDGVANAATGFDPETHEPLYRIALGPAGRLARAADRGAPGARPSRRGRCTGARRARAPSDRGAARRGGGRRASRVGGTCDSPGRAGRRGRAHRAGPGARGRARGGDRRRARVGRGRARACSRRRPARARGRARGAAGTARGDPGRAQARPRVETRDTGCRPGAGPSPRRRVRAGGTSRAGDPGARRAAGTCRAARGRRSGRGAVARCPRDDRGDRGGRGRGRRARQVTGSGSRSLVSFPPAAACRPPRSR